MQRLLQRHKWRRPSHKHSSSIVLYLSTGGHVAFSKCPLPQGRHKQPQELSLRVFG